MFHGEIPVFDGKINMFHGEKSPWLLITDVDDEIPLSINHVLMVKYGEHGFLLGITYIYIYLFIFIFIYIYI